MDGDEGGGRRQKGWMEEAGEGWWEEGEGDQRAGEPTPGRETGGPVCRRQRPAGRTSVPVTRRGTGRKDEGGRRVEGRREAGGGGSSGRRPTTAANPSRVWEATVHFLSRRSCEPSSILSYEREETDQRGMTCQWHWWLNTSQF